MSARAPLSVLNQELSLYLASDDVIQRFPVCFSPNLSQKLCMSEAAVLDVRPASGPPPVFCSSSNPVAFAIPIRRCLRFATSAVSCLLACLGACASISGRWSPSTLPPPSSGCAARYCAFICSEQLPQDLGHALAPLAPSQSHQKLRSPPARYEVHESPYGPCHVELSKHHLASASASRGAAGCACSPSICFCAAMIWSTADSSSLCVTNFAAPTAPFLAARTCPVLPPPHGVAGCVCAPQKTHVRLRRLVTFGVSRMPFGMCVWVDLWKKPAPSQRSQSWTWASYL
eukprot:1741105-Rhodomonas_salina.1